MESVIFNYYEADIRRSVPLGIVTLDYFLNSIKNPKPHIIKILDEVKKAAEEGNEALKSELKEKLYAFTPCVLVEGKRKYENIKHWTGLLVLDFDKLDSGLTERFKQTLFDSYSCIIACWLSPSKKGVKAILRIPICNSVQMFKEYHKAIEKEFNAVIGFDKTTQNCILPLFLSYDKEILIRKDATVWTKRIKSLPPQPVKQYAPKDRTNRLEKIAIKRIGSIIDNGHPQVRAIAFVFGGHCAGGNIEEYKALEILEGLIRSNQYLSKDVKGYIRTAKEMFQQGKMKPLYYRV